MRVEGSGGGGENRGGEGRRFWGGKIRVAKRGGIQYKERRFRGHRLRVWPRFLGVSERKPN